MITAEMYPVEVGKVALLKSNNRLVFVLELLGSDRLGDSRGPLMRVTYEHDGEMQNREVYAIELETPEARMIEEARFQKFMFDLTAQVNESAKTKGPELVQ